MTPLEIEVDPRERSSDLFRTLAGRPDLRLHVRILKAGDYALDGRRLGVERKSALDLARSLVDGRLFPQAARLAKTYPRPLLLVEGFDPRRAVPTLRGALVSLAAAFRIPVLFSLGPAASAEMLADAARQAARSFDDGYARAGYRPRGLRRRQLFILQGFPLVGPRRAAALLDRFGSLRAVFDAEMEELRKVAGVGVTVARALLSMARSTSSPDRPSDSRR